MLAMHLNRHFLKAGIQLESAIFLTFLVVRKIQIKITVSVNLSIVAMATNNDKRHDYL